MIRNPIRTPSLPVLAGLVLTLTLSLAVPASAQLTPDVSAGAGLFSKYTWRGLVVTDGPVLQPTASLGLGTASVGLWANVDLDDANQRAGEITEVDAWLEYGLGLGLVDVAAGVVHYGYPDAEGDTTELYAVGSVGVLLSPTLSLYRDLDAVDGLYANLAISHGLALTPEHTLDLAAGLGLGDADHNAGYYAGADGGAADASLTASWTWQPLPTLSVTPQVSWVTLLGDASDAMDTAGADTDAVVFGVSAALGL